MKNFLMPTLGADMEAGTLVAWRKQPGESVHRGETLAEVDTDKGVIDVEVFQDGVIDRLLVGPRYEGASWHATGDNSGKWRAGRGGTAGGSWGSRRSDAGGSGQ